MFCYQCQEALKNEGCTKRGVCGKTDEVAALQDLLIHTLKGIGYFSELAAEQHLPLRNAGHFAAQALFATITNANFDPERFIELINQAIAVRDELRDAVNADAADLPDAAVWHEAGKHDLLLKAASVGVLATPNEDIRSLRELIIYGLKGIAAYAHHAAILDVHDDTVYAFILKALAATLKELSADELTGMVLEAGETAVAVMAALDKANTEAYGNPELSQVNIGVGSNPGILVSGHDLKDIEELLKQTDGTGVDVYTHSEMLPANYYPAFKKYDHLIGNYGSSWWNQDKEFASFNGPILMTTNCIVPVKDSYKDRIFTSGSAGYPDVKHIADRPEGGTKDFSALIELAKTCEAPTEIETGSITGGFAHNQVMALADTVVEAVKSGAVKRFVVMAGCDGRQKERSYFTEIAEALPEDTIILTAGCAKYRYNKLDLGDIGGIPRVLDAGQCNDSYSLAVVALKLKEVFELDDINDLPISFDIGWYEQKAVAVLLALLHLGVKGIRLGPTLPAFVSPNVAKVLVDNFDIKPIGDVKADVEAMLAGQ